MKWAPSWVGYSMSDTDRQEQLMAQALAEIRRLKAENKVLQSGESSGNSGAVAVIGLACRMPGAVETPEALWDLLRRGESTISEVPAYRWSIDQYYSSDLEAPGKMACRFGSFLGEVDGVDCRLFGISPKEASYMDPQQRLLLELAWEVLESANYSADRVRGTDTGVFIGQSGFDFASQHMNEDSLEEINPYVGTGCAFSPAAGRISYTFDFTGPSYVVDTACSSSLVALHNACNSLTNRECSLAIVGASNLILGPGMSINFDKVGMLCADGIVKTFDKDAHGVVRSEGAGMVLLKRLDDALKDGDTIDGVILGSAINQDGASSSLMAPNGRSQRAVMSAALKRAGLSPEAVDYLEAHGTATNMGDPTELNAVVDVYCNKDRPSPLRIGSLKTNFGHMEASAGIAGVLKILLSLRYQEIPAQLNFSEGHPDIEWSSVPLVVCSEASDWSLGDRPRVAGINGFGFAGTNAHVLIAEAPGSAQVQIDQLTSTDTQHEGTVILLPVSAASPGALKSSVRQLAQWLEADPTIDLGAVERTLLSGRKSHRYRAAFSAVNDGSGRQALVKQLLKFAETGKQRGYSGEQSLRRHKGLRTAFVYCGHGAQYLGMSGQLYQQNAFYHETLNEIVGQAQPLLAVPLLPLLIGDGEGEPAGNMFETSKVDGPLSTTVVAQVATFCVQVALTRLWRHWGIEPTVLMGHSLGEYTAACVAGVFGVDDALRLLVARATLMDKTAPGKMITVFHDEHATREIVAQYDDAAVAAVNGPGIVLLSGGVATIESVKTQVDVAGGRAVDIPIDRAFHSPLAEPIVDDFAEILKTVKRFQPTIPVISNLTGHSVDNAITEPEYWLQHLVRPVEFMTAITTLHGMDLDVLLEISPEPVVMGLDLCFQQIREEQGSSAFWLSSLKKTGNDQQHMLHSLGQLFRAGAALDRYGSELAQGGLLRLPFYGFDRQRCWSEAAQRAQSGACVMLNPPVAESQTNAEALSAQDIPNLGTQGSPIAAGVHSVMLEHVKVIEQYLQAKRAERQSVRKERSPR